MKLTLNPNYEKFSFQELVAFYNEYLGEKQDICIKIMDDGIKGKCTLYSRHDGALLIEITELLLRQYFVDEVKEENIDCFGFFNKK